jgi:hypothetical protein
MTERPKGGRGKTVPYKSTSVRVPEPLLEQCHEMIDFYQEFLKKGGDPDNPPNYLAEVPRYESPQTEESPEQPIYYKREGSRLYDLGDVDEW